MISIYSKSKDPPSFTKTSGQSGGNETSRVVKRSSESPGQHQTHVIVKETRTNTPQGVKTVKSTTTWTTSSNVQMISTEDNDKIDQPVPKLKSLHISDKEKPATKQTTSAPQDEPSGSFQEQALSMHNRYRRKHQAPDLRWNDDLARDAQAWAEKIARQNKLQHASSQQRNGDGENLAFFGGK